MSGVRDSDQKGRFAYPELDRVLHERARLGILSCLITHQVKVAFSELRDLCGLTDGNLSRHLKALEEAGIVALEREEKEGARPTTWIAFTRGGRKRFLDYVEVLESIVRTSAASARAVRRAAPVVALPDGGAGRVPA
jgi:DNA-binding transcriptional ArsR family regulator